jgi:DNA repair exonuclease SbcCD ATPase subunit
MLKWIQQQSNPLVSELQLELDGETESNPERIAAWVRDKHFSPENIAAEIEEILASISAEQDTRITGRLVWLTDKGARWTSFPIRVEPESGSQAFDGSARNLLVQQQRHIEGIALTYFKATDNVLKTYASTLESLTNLLETRENRAADLEIEVARLRDENAQLSSQAIQTEAIAEEAVKQAEQAADEMAAKKDSAATDGQMIKLLSKVAGDMIPPKKVAPRS